MDSIAKELNIIHWEEWYNIQYKKFLEFSPPISLLQKHGKSLVNILINVYPEHPWKPWRFDKVN